MTLNGTGWILDAYVERDGVSIWVRTDENTVIKVKDSYTPTIYLLPQSPGDAERIFTGLRDETDIKSLAWAEKFTSLGDVSPRKLLQIEVSLSKYKRLLGALRKLDHPPQIFNADLLHVQQYLFTKLRIEPTSKVRFSSDRNGSLTEIEKLDDEKEIAPPPFTTLTFKLLTDSSSLTPDRENDPIRSIAVRYGDEDHVTSLEGREDEVLGGFEAYVRAKDPDFIVAPTCDDFTFPYLFTRAKKLGLSPQLGREPVNLEELNKPLPGWVRGRVAIDYMYYGATSDDWGIAGLVERARFAFLPPGIAGRWTANRVNDSRICYELFQRGFVIPRDTGYFETIRPVEEIFDRDRGGIIISPKIGVVHENVGEIDYESEFPQIIVKENISFETVTTDGMRKKTDAVLPAITRRILERRLYFKRLRKTFEKGSREWVWCEQRQQAGKMVLVCVTPDTNVMMADGNERPIFELQDRSNDSRVLSFSPTKRQIGPSAVIDYISLRNEYSDFEAYSLEVESGRRITATGDHPFYTRGGWVPLRDIREGEYVAIHPKAVMRYSSDAGEESMPEFEIVADSDIIQASPAHTDTARALRILKERNLVTLKSTDPRLPIVGRLMGHLFSDGALSLSYGAKKWHARTYVRADKMICLSGATEKDVRDLLTDVKQLGFDVPKGAVQRVATPAVVVNVDGSEHRFVQNSFSVVFTCAPLWLLFRALGCPVGEKAVVDYSLPHWLRKASRVVRREFLAAYVGGDGSKPDWDERGFRAPYFCLAKILNLERDGVAFTEQVTALLREFGVAVTRIKSHPERGRMRKDGRRSTAIIAWLGASHDNLLALYEGVGLRYSESKEAQLPHLIEFLRIRRNLKRLRLQSSGGRKTPPGLSRRRLVLEFLRDHEGEAFYTTELATMLAHSSVTHGDVAKAAYEYGKRGLLARINEKQSRIPGLVTVSGAAAGAILQQRFEEDYNPERASFYRWLERTKVSLDGTPFVWERVVRKEEVRGVRDVRDLTVEPDHSFIANGFVTHNCIYGTSGCCWNRFGNVLAFEEINRKSRKVMIQTKEFVQDNGFEIIRAVVDSVFVKKPGAAKQDYEALARGLSAKTRLPSSLDHHFKFLLLLPLEGDPSMIMEAQNRYFGVLYDGEIVARGIEIRRHDTPPFIKNFQLELIRTLFDYESAEEIYSKGYEQATLLVTRAIDQIMAGEIPLEDLVVSKILRKSVNQYRSLFPHVAAAIRLTSLGKTVSEGDNIQYLFTDAGHLNPLCRVVAKDEVDSKVSIDREKYREMLLDAAETVLSTFGFSRASYGLPVSPKSWVQEIWEDRMKERRVETETEDLQE